jgi:hypothetical protein
MTLNVVLNIVWVFPVHFGSNFKSISDGCQVIAGVGESYSHLELHAQKSMRWFHIASAASI